MKFLLNIFIVFILSACATTAKYEELLNTWLGQNINTLIDSWGYPENSFEGPNGNKVYVYSDSESYTSPTQTYGTTTTGGYIYSLSCQTFFEVNSSNVIVKWRKKGNNCKTR